MNTDSNTSADRVIALNNEYREYAQARKIFLKAISVPKSCRDPLAEYSEVLVAVLIDAKMADSRVQKGYDLIRRNGRRVQVKYLANPTQGWINEHEIIFTSEIDDYALVIFAGLDLETVLIFPAETIGQVNALLRKRHPKQDTTLQFTQKNYRTIIQNKSDFIALGVEIYFF